MLSTMPTRARDLPPPDGKTGPHVDDVAALMA